jgi:hypothetical protein
MEAGDAATSWAVIKRVRVQAANAKPMGVVGAAMSLAAKSQVQALTVDVGHTEVANAAMSQDAIRRVRVRVASAEPTEAAGDVMRKAVRSRAEVQAASA